jgi:mono/diheme cytochrome c family protein
MCACRLSKTSRQPRSGRASNTLLCAALLTFLGSSHPGAGQRESSTGDGLRQSSRMDSRENSGKSAVKKLYRLNCVRCHGKDGKGTEARDKTTEIPDFTDDSWQETRSDAEFSVSILDGKGRYMPAFGDRLANEQIRSLVAYVRGFDSLRRRRVSSSTSDFEERFRQLQDELGELQKQFRDCRREKSR